MTHCVPASSPVHDRLEPGRVHDASSLTAGDIARFDAVTPRPLEDHPALEDAPLERMRLVQEAGPTGQVVLHLGGSADSHS